MLKGIAEAIGLLLFDLALSIGDALARRMGMPRHTFDEKDDELGYTSTQR